MASPCFGVCYSGESKEGWEKLRARVKRRTKSCILLGETSYPSFVRFIPLVFFYIELFQIVLGQLVFVDRF